MFEMNKKTPEEANQELQNSGLAKPRQKSLDRRLNDISYHTNKLAKAVQDLNDNIEDLRYEINNQINQ